MLHTIKLAGREVRDILYHLNEASRFHRLYEDKNGASNAEKMRNIVFAQFRESQKQLRKGVTMDKRFEAKHIYTIDADDFDALVAEQFPEIEDGRGQEYAWSFQASEEMGDDTSRVFKIDAKDADNPFWALPQPVTWQITTREILVELLRRGIIVPGEYVITQD